MTDASMSIDPAEWGSLYDDPDGYLRVTRIPRSHPLAPRTTASVSLHRLLHFEDIGYGPHRCEDCGRHVNWGQPGADRLTVDHRNAVLHDLRPENLATSCTSCNHRRRVSLGRGRRRKTLYPIAPGVRRMPLRTRTRAA